MKNPALILLILIATLASISAKPKMEPNLNIAIQVPNPGWSISIESIHLKEKELIIVCQASLAKGMHPSVMSTAEASAHIDPQLARLPQKIYLLGHKWNYSSGFTPATKADLKKITTNAKSIYTSPGKDKNITPDSFIGLPRAQAEALADEHNLPHRVVMIDGKPLPTTKDLRPNRLNFTLTKGKVTKVTKG